MYFDLTFFPIDKFVKKKRKENFIKSFMKFWSTWLFKLWTKHFFFFLPIHYTLSYFVCKILPSLIYLFLSFSAEGGKENSTMFIIIFPLAAGGLLLALSGLIILRRMQKKRRDLKLQGISADCF